MQHWFALVFRTGYATLYRKHVEAIASGVLTVDCSLMFGYCAVSACEMFGPFRIWKHSIMAGQQYVIMLLLDPCDLFEYVATIKAASNERTSSCSHPSMFVPRSYHIRPPCHCLPSAIT